MKIGLCGALCAISLALLVTACGEEDPTPGDTTSSSTTTGTGGAGGTGGTGGAGGMGGMGGMPMMPGSADVTVNYAGAQTGTLSIAAFKQFPPMSLPAGVAPPEAMPTFPEMGTILDLPPGTYYFTAILDIGNNNPMSPGPEDLQAVTMPPVEVMPGMAAKVELTLMDKP